MPGIAGGRDTLAVTLFVDSDDLARATLRQRLIGAGAPIDAIEARDLPGMLELAPGADLVLLDAALPGIGPADAIAALREHNLDVPVIVTSNDDDPEVMRAALDAGAISFVLKNLDPVRVRGSVEAALAGFGALDPHVVRPILDRYALLLDSASRRDRAIIESLAAAVEAKDTVTSNHIHAVGRLALALAELVEPGLADSEDFLFGCLLHDVGKIGVPERILNKPGPLTREEWAVMRRHPETGVRVIGPLGLSPTISDLVMHHHERWDGDGYPGRLAGDRIPLPARIFAVCDTLDAMTARRPYREPVSPRTALAEVHAEAGRQFDPGVVAALETGVRRGDIDVHGVLAAASAAS